MAPFVLVDPPSTMFFFHSVSPAEQATTMVRYPFTSLLNLYTFYAHHAFRIMTQLITPTDIHIPSLTMDATMLRGPPRFVTISEIPEEECVGHPFLRNWRGYDPEQSRTISIRFQSALRKIQNWITGRSFFSRRRRSRATPFGNLPNAPGTLFQTHEQQMPSSSNARQGSSQHSSRRTS